MAVGAGVGEAAGSGVRAGVGVATGAGAVVGVGAGRGASFATALMVCALASIARRFRFEPVGDALPQRKGMEFGAFPGPVMMTVGDREHTA